MRDSSTPSPRRPLIPAALMTFAILAPAALAQDGPLRRAGRALDNAGKNVRNRVETEIDRGQAVADERDLARRVALRIQWDKKLATAAIRLRFQPDGTAVLRGSVADAAAKARAVDLVENTIGVTAVVDELAVVKEVRVIKTAPARRALARRDRGHSGPPAGRAEVIVKP